MSSFFKVELIRENADGSVDYMFNLSPESVAAFARLGIMTAIQAGIGEAKKMNPDYEVSSDNDFNPDWTVSMKEHQDFIIEQVINLLMIQHEAAKSSHNYWHTAANLIKAEFVHDSDTSQKHVHKSDKNEHDIAEAESKADDLDMDGRC